MRRDDSIMPAQGQDAPSGMSGLITWVGSKTCDACSAIGPDHSVQRSCLATNGLYGIGLITCVAIGLFLIGAFLLWR